MKLSAHRLSSLNKEYNELKKKDRIISIDDIKKKSEAIIKLQNELEDLMANQRYILEESDCSGDSCEIKVSDLYDFYDEIEDKVIDCKFYEILYMIN